MRWALLGAAYQASVADHTQPRCGAQPGRSLPASLMQVPFDLIGTAYAVLDQHSAQRLSEQYREADVALEVAVPTHRADALRAALRDATSGRVDARPSG